MLLIIYLFFYKPARIYATYFFFFVLNSVPSVQEARVINVRTIFHAVSQANINNAY